MKILKFFGVALNSVSNLTWNILALLFATSLFFSTSDAMLLKTQNLEIILKNGDELEKVGKIQLMRIISNHKNEINNWIFTRKILIDKNTIPHSHPILTLNCNYIENDNKQLSNFLHEQFHWYLEDKSEQREKAISKFKELFPNVPVKGEEGARSEYSTYLHLIVCDLEFQAMIKVVGEESARQILTEWSHYKWIYKKVLNDKRIREVNIENGFLLK